MSILPDTYFLSVAIFCCLLILGLMRLGTTWGAQYNVVLCTVAAWYFVEPAYLTQEFKYLYSGYVATAYDSVALFFIAFGIVTPVLVRWCRPRDHASVPSGASVSAERLLVAAAAVWIVLLAYGVMRMQGDLIGTLFPIGGRTGARMWGRAAAADAGSTGFIVSIASYIYSLVLASFGLLFFLLRRQRYRVLAIALILLSWPYVFLQGSRSTALVVVIPAIVSFLLYSRRSFLFKGLATIGSFFVLETLMLMMLTFRNIGFQEVDMSLLEGRRHLGLNMASELVYIVEFVQNGVLELSYGGRYLAELANVIPRALWPDKPLIDIDYAIARGYGGSENDIGVSATITPGMIGQGVLNFGTVFGPIAVAILMGAWVALLARFRAQGTPLRLALFLVGIGLTFNLGRQISLLVLWPIVFGYFGVRVFEVRQRWRDRNNFVGKGRSRAVAPPRFGTWKRSGDSGSLPDVTSSDLRRESVRKSLGGSQDC